MGYVGLLNHRLSPTNKMVLMSGCPFSAASSGFEDRLSRSSMPKCINGEREDGKYGYCCVGIGHPSANDEEGIWENYKDELALQLSVERGLEIDGSAKHTYEVFMGILSKKKRQKKGESRAASKNATCQVASAQPEAQKGRKTLMVLVQ